MGLDYKKTFIIGLGFFTTAITWSLFNSYVPIFLGYFGIPFVFIGFIMTLDNIAAITLQPYMGALSDKTWNRFGRRMPYILLGIPLAAFFFVLIPFSVPQNIQTFGPVDIVLDSPDVINLGFIFFTIWIICFNIAMAIYRAPVVALMPDLTEDEYRSRANGIINLMGGIGSVFAFAAGSYLYKINAVIPFIVTSGLMILALAILVWKIKEPEVPVGTINEEDKVNIIEGFREVFANKDRSILFILMAIFLWFFGYQAVETWFTTFGKDILLISEATASFYLNLIAIPFILTAIPAGILAERFSRKKTIIVGLIMIISCLAVIIIISMLVPPINPILAPLMSLFVSSSSPGLLTAILILFPVVGVGWSLVNINSITIVWEIAKGEKQGAYTGIYYFFSQTAAIVGPLAVGFTFDLVGTPLPLFPFSLIFFILALLSMFGVKSGEVET
ncbi:MAG: MFS transporter [Candidatus Helarchaeota archaeon]